MYWMQTIPYGSIWRRAGWPRSPSYIYTSAKIMFCVFLNTVGNRRFVSIELSWRFHRHRYLTLHYHWSYTLIKLFSSIFYQYMQYKLIKIITIPCIILFNFLFCKTITLEIRISLINICFSIVLINYNTVGSNFLRAIITIVTFSTITIY